MQISNYKSVLFIAPSDSGLNVTPEIDSIYKLGYKAHVLQGDVDSERIFDVVSENQFDILHFACHDIPGFNSETSGLALSKNSRGEPRLLNTDAILQVARMTGAKLVFLNACSTSVIGQTLIDEGIPIVIVTMKDVRDDLAKQTAQAFYKNLAMNGDPQEAYRASKPASRGIYQFLTNGAYKAMLLDPILKKLEDITQSNEQEHCEFRDLFNTQRAFYIRTSLALVSIVFIINLIFFIFTR